MESHPLEHYVDRQVTVKAYCAEVTISDFIAGSTPKGGFSYFE